jgi:predicted metal-dependent enzyme (double-stranded beta helix superfamily)
METQFHNYCRKWSDDIAQIGDEGERMAYFQRQLPELLLDRDTVRRVMMKTARGGRWPDLRRSGLFSHEVLLYLDPSRRFSIRLYFHPPQSHTDIHDHTSWGVSGTPFGRLSVINYTYKGDLRDEHVRLYRLHQKVLLPGEVDLTRPWDEGIHQTGSPDDRLNVMISAYGRPGRRLYINCFNAESGRVKRLYPPRLLRRMLAKEALAAFK